MLTRMIQSKLLIVAAAAVGLAANASAKDVEVKVENYSNETLVVALAYNHFDGLLITEGWYVIKPGETKKFKRDQSNDMYMRIEQSGKEVTFEKHTVFLNWPVNSSRFDVKKEPDDNSIRVLRSGDNLNHKVFINKGDKLPAGWSQQRFFRIGSHNTKLEIKP